MDGYISVKDISDYIVVLTKLKKEFPNNHDLDIKIITLRELLERYHMNK